MSVRKDVATVFYDNENDSETKQRIKNGLFLKWWVRSNASSRALTSLHLLRLVGSTMIVWCCLGR
jgi:hypothetical protein